MEESSPWAVISILIIQEAAGPLNVSKHRRAETRALGRLANSLAAVTGVIKWKRKEANLIQPPERPEPGVTKTRRAGRKQVNSV